MELLKQLYSIHSMSGQEGAMRKFVKNHVKGLPGDITLRQDHGNIYITKGVADSYPCLVAHLDQVQTKHSADFRTFEQDGCLFGFSFQNKRVEGLGADDKNGIWIALKCLESLPVLKVALFKEEEIGCGGSRVADMAFFKDCRYCVQADRKHGGDLITDIGGAICSEEFIRDIQPLMDRYGYKQASGLMTDVETLSDSGVGISCVNLSCGYYEPHTDHEYTNINELYNALAFVQAIVGSLDKVYPFERPVRPVWSGWGGAFGGRGGYDRVEGLWDEPVVYSVLDYNDLDAWLEDLVYYNCGWKPEDIYPHVSAEWEDLVGLEEEDFYRAWMNCEQELYGGWTEEEEDIQELAYAG